MNNAFRTFLALAVLAAGPAAAAPIGASAVLLKLDLSKAGVFAAAPAADLPAPPLVTGAAVPAQVQAQDKGPAAPDWSVTPGKLCTASDPDFKEYRYPEHVPYCNRHVTKEMKQAVAARYGIPPSDWSKYEFDHLIPLGIGGNSQVDNLWPQPRGADESDGKDKLEAELFDLLKTGAITQAEAVRRDYAWFGVPPQNRLVPLAAR